MEWILQVACHPATLGSHTFHTNLPPHLHPPPPMQCNVFNRRLMPVPATRRRPSESIPTPHTLVAYHMHVSHVSYRRHDPVISLSVHHHHITCQQQCMTARKLPQAVRHSIAWHGMAKTHDGQEADWLTHAVQCRQSTLGANISRANMGEHIHAGLHEDASPTACDRGIRVLHCARPRSLKAETVTDAVFDPTAL
jgi:hypothetical protein